MCRCAGVLLTDAEILSGLIEDAGAKVESVHLVDCEALYTTAEAHEALRQLAPAPATVVAHTPGTACSVSERRQRGRRRRQQWRRRRWRRQRQHRRQRGTGPRVVHRKSTGKRWLTCRGVRRWHGCVARTEADGEHGAVRRGDRTDAHERRTEWGDDAYSGSLAAEPRGCATVAPSAGRRGLSPRGD